MTYSPALFVRRAFTAAAFSVIALSTAFAQASVNETRDPNQKQDAEFAKLYKEWTGDAKYGSPLVDHLPIVRGIPTPKDVLGYYIGAPAKLTYYADILKYYRALAKASPRVKVETIGKSDEGRELVVVWISSDENIRNLAKNRANLAKIADPRGMSEAQVRAIMAKTKPSYHLMGGLHSGETGPSEMLMELAYRLVTETSPLITQIRNNVYVSITPAAEPDGRDRNVDWFYQGLATAAADSIARGGKPAPRDTTNGRGGRGGAGVPYWGKYVYHDNTRDINLSQVSMRAITDWYFTAHPPIMHDLHEAEPLMYVYSGGPPQNPNLDPILFTELPFFANWDLEQMTKYGMPGVYTFAFMDGWSPGYLGSVAYNHNGMMRMYEIQSGREGGSGTTVAAADSVAGHGRSAAAGGDSASGRGGRGGRGGRAEVAAAGARGAGAGGRGGPPPIPTGKGGSQPREWYRGLPIPPNAIQDFTRRDNTNYGETGVLSGLQLTSMFPELVLENFYIMTRHSITAGTDQAPYGFVFPVQRDMTKVATLINILRAQGIEVGELSAPVKSGTETFPTGSYLVKLNQPYGRLAKNLLEKQIFPDPALTTYDDSGWYMGFAFNVDVREIKDSTILEAKAPLIKLAEVKVPIVGSGTAGLAVAHLGSNNMITFRYRLKATKMRIAEASFTADGVTFPAGSFIVTGTPAELQAAQAQVESLGLTAAALSALPTVASHDAVVARIAIYSQWSGTQDLGWYRYTFDRFGIPYDLIFKERVEKGNLKNDYDVIIMAAQNINRATVLAPHAAKPVPYMKSDKYKSLGVYGESPDITGGFGATGVEAFEKFLDGGGTLITAAQAVHFPIDFGFAHTVDTENPTGVKAEKPLITAEILRPEHPVFYGYGSKIFPVKYGQETVFKVGVADQSNVLAEYVGGDSSVLSGLMVGADKIKGNAFVVDVPNAYDGHGRVIMFANNPIYRWQNHGEFNMVFNSILNWSYVPPAPPLTAPVVTGRGGRGAP
ncbi:MAG: M14 family zinc carboxypeptidase [Gemmatimonadaceae bacterium]